jgi:hypothetical protein
MGLDGCFRLHGISGAGYVTAVQQAVIHGTSLAAGLERRWCCRCIFLIPNVSIGPGLISDGSSYSVT